MRSQCSSSQHRRPAAGPCLHGSTAGASQLSRCPDDHWLAWAVAAARGRRLNLLHHIKALQHGAKHDVPAVQPGRRHGGDEELRGRGRGGRARCTGSAAGGMSGSRTR